MTINLKDDKLVITFKFSPEIIAAVRAIPGRQFNLSRKRWEVPAENAIECVETLSRFGLTPTLEVRRVLEAQRQARALAEEIKTTPAAYEGDLPLFDFQKVGVKFLKTMPHALLADVPGLGKTIQTIAATEKAHNRLVLCPASLKYMWEGELKKWVHGDSIYVVDGTKLERRAAWESYAGWTIANYELLLHDFAEIKKHESDHGPWEVIVCDEATRIANPHAKTVKALQQLKALKRIALTGTPISNSPEDIFSLIDWLSPRYLGSYYQFLEEYCVREPRFHRIVGYKNLGGLSERIARFMLRRTKEEVLKDLPLKTIEDIPFELSEKERKLYNGVRERIWEEVRGLDINPNTLALVPVKMLRLKQVTDHPALVTEGNVWQAECSKLEALKDLLDPIMKSLD